MADTKQFSRLTKITKGNTPSTDLKMTDIFAMQHIDLPSGANAYKQVSLAQSLCEPIAVTPNSTPSDGAYTATCSNYPDFSLTYTDASGNSHYLIGLKVRVVFTKGITYGSVSGGTYPTLNINGSGAIPLLAQGMTMAKGAAQNGQTIEFTIIPYGNGVAFDADSNVRESTSDYTIYTDGLRRVNTVESNNMGMVTSGGVYNSLKPFKNWQKWNVDGTRYILLYDITDWWNSTSSTPVLTKTIIGSFHLGRYAGWCTTDILEVTVQVGFYKDSSTNFHNSLGCKIFGRSLTGALKIALIKYNNKYYIALKNIIATWSMQYDFWGNYSNGILGTDVPDGTTVEDVYITP